MEYLSHLIGRDVVDAQHKKLGQLQDISIVTDEAFPRFKRFIIKSDKQSYTLSWSKTVELISPEHVELKIIQPELRPSYVQDDEIFFVKDLLDKPVIDTRNRQVFIVRDICYQAQDTPRIIGLGCTRPIRLRKLLSASENPSGSNSDPHTGMSILSWSYLDLITRDLSLLDLNKTHRLLTQLHPADISSILIQLDDEHKKFLLERLGNDVAADVLSELETDEQTNLVSELSERNASDMIEYMDPDDAADIIAELPQEKADKILRLMNSDEEEVIRRLMSYSEDSAGGLMTSEFVVLNETIRVDQAIEELRKLDEDHESVYYIYTCDDDEVLKGVLSIRTLILAQGDQLLKDLAFSDLICVNTDEKPEEVYQRISKYDLVALPVIDANHKMVGVITVDDALDHAGEADEKNYRYAYLISLSGNIILALILLIVLGFILLRPTF